MDKIQEQKIKAFISKNVFIDGRCGQPDQTIFREIIFDSKNNINWQKALQLTIKYMPELIKDFDLLEWKDLKKFLPE
jgi:hypothetical protein